MRQPNSLIPALCAAALIAASPAIAAPTARLAEDRVLREFGAELPEGAQIEIALRSDVPDVADFIADFRMDRHTGRFLGLFVAADGTTFRGMGVATISVSVAVPARKLMPGEVIALSDLETVSVPLADMGAFAIGAADALVGKEVRRVLRKGRPVMQQSVATPFAVERGDQVTILLSDGGLQLSAPGRALADAHVDEPVRVVNLSSSKTISALVTGEGRVEVSR